MKESSLRRADLIFSLALMCIGIYMIISSFGLLINPFGRDFSLVSGDEIKANIEEWYLSPGLLPFIIGLLLLICAIALFSTARKRGAKIDFLTREKVIALFRKKEFFSAIIVIGVMSIYAFVLMPVCRKYLDFFPKFQGFPFMIATFVYLLVQMIVFNDKSWKKNLVSLVVSAAGAVAITYGFGILAQIPLP